MRLPALLVALLPLAAQALEVNIDPHADLLYRQALPLLEQADNQEEGSSTLRTSLGADPELSRQGQAMAHTLPTAVALLKKSVELGHPVAQYRLALYYMTYLPAAQIPEAACPLLEASLKQGFAAPAPAIATWCQPYNASSDYRTALEAIPSMATVYAPYYPQPATQLAGRGVPPAQRTGPTAPVEPAAEGGRHQWLRDSAATPDPAPLAGARGHYGRSRQKRCRPARSFKPTP